MLCGCVCLLLCIYMCMRYIVIHHHRSKCVGRRPVPSAILIKHSQVRRPKRATNHPSSLNSFPFRCVARQIRLGFLARVDWQQVDSSAHQRHFPDRHADALQLGGGLGRHANVRALRRLDEGRRPNDPRL